jgi:hypothetical protein
MFSFFKKNKKSDVPKMEAKKLIVKSLDYHPKIILAWAKALEGNKELANYLNKNGFEELVIANSAIWLKDEARTWLMNNGFPHLMAMIHAAEGDAKARKWLLANDFEILFHIAMAVENEENSWKWLNQHATQDIFLFTKSFKKIKDSIEENHNDMHSFNKD